MENVEVFIRNALGAVKWIVLNKCKCDAEDRDKVLRVVDRALKELDVADLNKVWHQAKDVMPPRIYGGNHADLLCVHQFKPTSHPILTHEENCISLSTPPKLSRASCRIASARLFIVLYANALYKVVCEH